jgi:hypothetical protein
MSLASMVEVWDGDLVDYATILNYQFNHCGWRWERHGEVMKQVMHA